MTRHILIGCVLAAVSGALLAAEDLQPAVDTSAPAVPAPDTSAAPARAPVTRAPPAATSTAPPLPATAAPRTPAPAGTRPPPAGTQPAPATASGAAGAAGAPRASSGSGADRVELENTQITGNRELPKVMYVVPWKKPDLGSYGGRPAKSLLDELLEPVDRDVFKRQNRYFDALQPDAAAPAAGDEK